VNGDGSDVRERAAQLLAAMVSRRSGASGNKRRGRAIGPGKDTILAVFKSRVELSGDQVSGETGRERQGAGRGSEADSWGPHQQVPGYAGDSGRQEVFVEGCMASIANAAAATERAQSVRIP